VLGGAVGGGAEHLFGGGVDGLEGAAPRAGGQPPVQQQQAIGSSGHLSRLQFRVGPGARPIGRNQDSAGSAEAVRPPGTARKISSVRSASRAVSPSSGDGTR